MLKPSDLLPTKKEARKLFLEVWKYLLVALLGLIGLAVPSVRAWLSVHFRDLRAFGGRDIIVHGWLIFVSVLCALFTLVQIARWIIVLLQPKDVRLFRSLSRNEQRIMVRLAESEYGLTEGELHQAVPVSPQYFLRFIDRLVNDLHLAERTEPSNGGAFWALSDEGRRIAAANRLFPA